MSRKVVKQGARCSHDMVVLCYKEGWFCMDCRKIVDHDCSYKGDDYRYGITGYRVGSKIGHRYASKYVRAGAAKQEDV